MAIHMGNIETDVDGLDLIVSTMMVFSLSLAVSALLYPDCQRDQGPLMLTGTEMIPLQCKVMRSEISWQSSGLRWWLRNRAIDSLVASSLNVLYTTTGSLEKEREIFSF